jgi:hypothetical protein
MNKGQTQLAVILWAVGIMIPVLGGTLAWTYSGFKDSVQVHTEIRQELADTKVKLAADESAIQAMKDDIKEIKDMQKAMINALNIKYK